MNPLTHRLHPAARQGALALAVAALLAGCAARNALHEDQSLIAQHQTGAGLDKLQQAVKLAPDDARYRLAYINHRDKALAELMADASRAAAAGDGDAARAALQQVLALDPRNQPARTALADLDAQLRNRQLLADVAQSMSEKRYEEARGTLNRILRTQPDNASARSMLQELDGRTQHPQLSADLAQAYRQPITLEFRDAPLRQVFQVLAQRSGLNFVFDKDVRADSKVSLYLKNSTVEQALYFMLVSNQLERQVMDGNTLLIYPNLPAKVREYQETVVKTFFLNSADAKELAASIKTLLKSRDVVVDEKLNAVIVRDSPEAVQLAARLVALQDRPEPEVVLDVEVLEVSRSKELNLGINWPQSLSLTPLSTTGGSQVTVGDLTRLRRDTLSLGSPGPTAVVHANALDGNANILANPRIRVRNREKAKILVGDKVPVITATVGGGVGAFASESVNYVDVGLTLNVEPTIYLNNDIGIKIALEVSSLGSATTTSNGSRVFQIGTRQASTLLQLHDGENQVLAGLINNQENEASSKVPGLGEFPLLGRLFGGTDSSGKRTEIVLSITPHLVRNIERPADISTEFLAGTEANYRKRPLPAEPASAATATAARPRPVVNPLPATAPASTAALPPERAGVLMMGSGVGGQASGSSGMSLYQDAHVVPPSAPAAADPAAPAPAAAVETPPPAPAPAPAPAPVPVNGVPSSVSQPQGGFGAPPPRSTPVGSPR
ncbi:MAG: Type II secretion system protein D [Stenotrophomonas maltophilia]|uniref:Type II secretion system protein D n=1 Tax=Stenotrophomonas maltophilia TaxID=40324 RepID=A0A7V8FI21_STEMA|nr:MAG: Type II secretion system protein D [Stenotrophomonas maltophilia]